jgi:putative polyketide hydroxylase
LPADEEAPMFALLIGYQYRSAAVVFDDPAPADPRGVALVEELRAQPGTRVPHAWVHRAGQRISTLDLVGPGFTLFTGSSGAPWAAAAKTISATLKVPIGVHSIGADGDIHDIEGRWSEVTGLSPDEALLVRPDGFVAWRTSPESPEERLGQVLCQVLGRGK